MLWQSHDDIAVRVRRDHRQQFDDGSSAVVRRQAVGGDRGRQNSARLGAVGPARAFRPQCRTGHLLDHLGAAIGMADDRRALEILRAVDVIGMVVRVHDVTEWLVGDAPDRGDERLSVQWRRQRVDHQHAILTNNDAGIRDARIVASRASCLDVRVDAGGDLFQLGLPRGRKRVSRIGRRRRRRHPSELSACQSGASGECQCTAQQFASGRGELRQLHSA